VTYTVVVLKETDGMYSVSVPALRGCHTCGETLPEALEMAEDCIGLFLESLAARGKPIPADVETFTTDVDEAVEVSVFKMALGEREAAPIV
jgi:predicted RNase H-like HicB family nuclease